MDYLEYLKNSFKIFMFDEKAVKDLKKNNDIFFGVATFSFLMLISSFISLAFETNTFISVSDIFFNLSLIIISIFFLLVFIFLSLSLFHLILKLFKAEGNIKDTISIGLSLFILSNLLTLPFAIVNQSLLETLELDNLIVFVSILALFMIAIFIWILVVSVKSFSIVHKISQLRVFLSILAYFFSWFLILLIIGFLFSLLYLGLLGLSY